MSDLYAKIEEAEEFGPDDAKVLRDLMSHKSMQRALKNVLLEGKSKGQAMLSMDLQTQDSVLKAAGLQGEARGLIRAVDLFIEMVEGE